MDSGMLNTVLYKCQLSQVCSSLCSDLLQCFFNAFFVLSVNERSMLHFPTIIMNLFSSSVLSLFFFIDLEASQGQIYLDLLYLSVKMRFFYYKIYLLIFSIIS